MITRSELAGTLLEMNELTEQAFDTVFTDEMFDLMPEELVNTLFRACQAMADLSKEIESFAQEHLE